MKTLKKILNVILTFLLLLLICILIISVNLKTVIVDGIIKETIKTEILNTDYKAKNTISKEEINKITDDPRVQEILNSKEVQDLMNKYLDITIDGLLEEENLDEEKVEEEIYKIIKDNKKVLEEKTNTKIDDETINKIMNEDEVKQLSRNLVSNINSKKQTITKTEKEVLKGYKTMTSLKFQLILLGLIILDLLLVGIVNKSIKKCIKELGITFTVSGILISTMSIIVKIIVTANSMLKTFHMRNLFLSGVGVLLIGILLVIIYKVLKRKEKENDIS